MRLILVSLSGVLVQAFQRDDYNSISMFQIPILEGFSQQAQGSLNNRVDSNQIDENECKSFNKIKFKDTFMSQASMGEWFLQEVTVGAPDSGVNSNQRKNGGQKIIEQEDAMCQQLVLLPPLYNPQMMKTDGNFMWLLFYYKNRGLPMKKQIIIKHDIHCPVNLFQYNYLALADKDKLKTKIPKVPDNAQCSVSWNKTYRRWRKKYLREERDSSKRTRGNWAIVETNYKDYMVVYSCEQKDEYVYVFTREPKPPQIDVETIENILSFNFGPNYRENLKLKTVFQDPDICQYREIGSNIEEHE